jgi:hypothetical protein
MVEKCLQRDPEKRCLGGNVCHVFHFPQDRKQALNIHSVSEEGFLALKISLNY